MAPILFGAVVALSALACAGGPPAPGIAFPQHTWTGGGPAALGSGTLALEDGCLVLLPDTGGRSVLIVWPGDASVRLVDGEPLVDAPGGSARIGDEVELGGGFYEDLAFVRSQLRDTILPPACVTETIFMTTGFAG